MTDLEIYYGWRICASLIIFTIIDLVSWKIRGWNWNTPIGLYESTEMNIPFCIICSIFLMLLSPILSIGKIFYWLSHLGRIE